MSTRSRTALVICFSPIFNSTDDNNIFIHVEQDAKIAHAQPVSNIVFLQSLDVAMQTIFKPPEFARRIFPEARLNLPSPVQSKLF
jgi:hypothetical protein